MKYELLIKIICTFLSGAGFATTFGMLATELLNNSKMAIAFIIPIAALTLCAIVAEIIVHRFQIISEKNLNVESK